jgi:hypothetical protein
MTLHVRDQILDAVLAAVTGLPTTGARAFDSRAYPLEREELPGINVRFHEATERSTPGDFPRPRMLERTCRIQVVGSVQATTNYRKAANQIALEVESVLGAPGAGSPAKWLNLIGTELQISGSGEKPVGEITLTYEAFYITLENDATTPK